MSFHGVSKRMISIATKDCCSCRTSAIHGSICFTGISNLVIAICSLRLCEMRFALKPCFPLLPFSLDCEWVYPGTWRKVISPWICTMSNCSSHHDTCRWSEIIIASCTFRKSVCFHFHFVMGLPFVVHSSCSVVTCVNRPELFRE
jgi:hypothetical protein